MTRRPLALLAAGLAAGALAGCDLGGGTGTPSPGSRPSSVIPTASATVGISSSPAAPLSDVVPVIECPTSYGIPNPGPTGTAYPSTVALDIPATVAVQLAAYSDDYRDLAPVLGPRGWSCSVSVGADGSTGVVIYPPTAATPTPDSTGQIGPPLVSAHSDSACMGCVADTVCPFVPSAEAQLGFAGVACGSPPSQEEVTFVNGSPTTGATGDIQDVVEFTNPPGVSGDAAGSGGVDPAEGVLLYDNFSGAGTVGQTVYASEESCTLPASEQALCAAIIADFVTRAWLMGD